MECPKCGEEMDEEIEDKWDEGEYPFIKHHPVTTTYVCPKCGEEIES